MFETEFPDGKRGRKKSCLKKVTDICYAGILKSDKREEVDGEGEGGEGDVLYSGMSLLCFLPNGSLCEAVCNNTFKSQKSM